MHRRRISRILSVLPGPVRNHRSLMPLALFLCLAVVAFQLPIQAPRALHSDISSFSIPAGSASAWKSPFLVKFPWHRIPDEPPRDTFEDLELDWGDDDRGLYAAKIITPPSKTGTTNANDPSRHKAPLASPNKSTNNGTTRVKSAINRIAEGLFGPNGGKSKGTTKLHGHKYLPNGLMEVNPAAPHPVYDLIEKAEKRWKGKQDKASKTLEQAVGEYKRRYHRMPPKNFEKWWDYVVKNKVQLPDEYDQIFHDLEPFWGMNPIYVNELQKEWETDKELTSFTIANINGNVSYQGHSPMPKIEETVAIQRANEQVKLLKGVQQWIPDFRATFTAQDVPYQFMGDDMKSEARDLASTGEFFDPKTQFETSNRGWAYACPKTSALAKHNWTAPVSLTEPWRETKSFIWDQKLAMDPCLHPSHVHLNGFLDSHDIGPVPRKKMVPAFSLCTTQLHADILTVAMEMWTENIMDDPPWDEKKNAKLLWRGRNTGTHWDVTKRWNQSQRARLVKIANDEKGSLEVLPSTQNPKDEVGLANTVSKAAFNEALLDIAFSGVPIQCDPEVCEKVGKEYTYKESQTWELAYQWKYILDIDGNGWSARFKRLMTSNSLIFKTTIFPEWYTDRVQPWVHFVPIKVDLTDLYDVFQFFHGDSEGDGGHDGLAKKIGAEGKKWSLTYWRNEDMIAYMFRLFLEYGRVMSLDRDAMTFKWEDVKKHNNAKAPEKKVEVKQEIKRQV